nr:MAPK regulated corepressor interacting protein 2-like isoform X2 [Onthophagus taurus]
MSGPRMNMSQMNGNGRNTTSSRPQTSQRVQSSVERPTCAQHEDLIRYIHDSWNQVSQELDKTAVYYREQENHHLRNFEPFDLEAYWGRRVVQQSQNS